MADNKIQLPSSQGGLVRYSDEYTSRIMMGPITVVVMIVLVILIELFLHIRG